MKRKGQTREMLSPTEYGHWWSRIKGTLKITPKYVFWMSEKTVMLSVETEFRGWQSVWNTQVVIFNHQLEVWAGARRHSPCLIFFTVDPSLLKILLLGFWITSLAVPSSWGNSVLGSTRASATTCPYGCAPRSFPLSTSYPWMFHLCPSLNHSSM